MMRFKREVVVRNRLNQTQTTNNPTLFFELVLAHPADSQQPAETTLPVHSLWTLWTEKGGEEVDHQPADSSTNWSAWEVVLVLVAPWPDQ